MNNSTFILGIIAIYVVHIITSLPLLCSGTVEQQCCRHRRLSEDDAYAGIIIDPEGILNDDTKRIITDKLQQYSSPEFYYESSSAVNNSNTNNNVEPSEAEKVADQTVHVTTTTTNDDYKNDDIDDDGNIVDTYGVDCHNSEKCSIIRIQFAVAIVDDTAFRFYNEHDYDFGIDLLQHDNDNGNNNNNYSIVMMAEYVAKRLHNRLWDVKSNKEEGEEEKRIKTEEGTNKRGMTTLLDIGNREGYVSRWSYIFNRSSSHSPLMTRRSSSHLTNTSSDDSDNDDDDAITTSSSSSGDSYYAFGGDDDGDTTTTSVGGRGGRF
ncbi:hypothetical protein FRACYDRAFT_252664 [Fragilariopsis cylindrus CCMP1102]|uniref:Uncharacterized protein n=1 Tax=Fragilariopsis cylindrus CCMP1102 TaxID=635003 RepID=A0A1E7ELX3_9STRA|nr:hypothetical protein FRACYDRAFT_252664 [Fragilariopsis cylindrus CCMP1102]|eukprot:OEU06846.1 hypothetical protein FRACYDRAFT_252664 [Fragilariopsis cylindrus CCMP1102]